MKKLLLMPLLLAGSLTLAQEQKKFEISPMIGYNFAEGNFGIKDNGYPVVAVELQFNTPSSKLSPEFSLLYSPSVDYDGSSPKAGSDSDVYRLAFNGVYTFDTIGNVIPFAKAGAGIERIPTNTPSFDNGFFLDAGAGVKVPLSENIALKAEALYMAKVASENAGMFDSNLVAMVGLTFSFGDHEKTAAQYTELPKKTQEEKVVAEVEHAPVPIPEKKAVVAAPVVVKAVEKDDDNDGVVNSKDRCPNTVADAKVDTDGCNVDNDNDGILNLLDICPNTLPNEEVNSDGCPKTTPLNITFKNNSSEIKGESDAHIQAYAEFLIKHTNYSAKIIGYTDSLGSASYNKRLSQKRANAVMKLLISLGVNKKQLKAEGKGEASPIATNATPEGRAKNRRIEAELTRN